MQGISARGAGLPSVQQKAVFGKILRKLTLQRESFKRKWRCLEILFTPLKYSIYWTNMVTRTKIKSVYSCCACQIHDALSQSASLQVHFHAQDPFLSFQFLLFFMLSSQLYFLYHIIYHWETSTHLVFLRQFFHLKNGSKCTYQRLL